VAPWEYEKYCAAVESEVARFVEVVTEADPATPVPTCPGWSITKLVKHHGITHRWIEHVVRNRSQDVVRPSQVDAQLPDDDADFPGWLADGATSLLVTLRATDSDTPVWAWGADRHVRFWARRVYYEAVIHGADADLALGQIPEINIETAADGIEEFLTNLPHAVWLTGGLRELGRAGDTLHFHATDSDGEWMVTLYPDGPRWERGHGKGTVAVRGPVDDLLLLTYGRRWPDEERFTVFGDQELLVNWLTKTAF